MIVAVFFSLASSTWEIFLMWRFYVIFLSEASLLFLLPPAKVFEWCTFFLIVTSGSSGRKVTI